MMVPSLLSTFTHNTDKEKNVMQFTANFMSNLRITGDPFYSFKCGTASQDIIFNKWIHIGGW